MSDLAVKTAYSIVSGYWHDFIRDKLESARRKFQSYIDTRLKTLQDEERRTVMPVKLDKIRLYNFKGELVKEFYESRGINELA